MANVIAKKLGDYNNLRKKIEKQVELEAIKIFSKKIINFSNISFILTMDGISPAVALEGL